jgi:hypothetical protein
MTTQEFADIISRRGWCQEWVGPLLGYSSRAVWYWLRRGRTVPPEAIAWAKSLPPLPSLDPSYPPTVAGLDAFLRSGQYSVTELAQMLGVSHATVSYWTTGQRKMPGSVKAWLEHGCPEDWPWLPPGFGVPDANIYGRKRVVVDPHHGCSRNPKGVRVMYPSHTERGWRWRRVGGPSSGLTRQDIWRREYKDARVQDGVQRPGE